MGAPITAYNRISENKIRVHSNIYYPEFVVVVDETLLSSVPVTKGLSKEGAIVINTDKTPDEVKLFLNGYEGRVHTIDARKISEDALGMNFPNTPMLAAIVKISRIMEEEKFIKEMQNSFEHKFASKPEVIEENMKALKTALQEVR